jgi:hypothetical protein
LWDSRSTAILINLLVKNALFGLKTSVIIEMINIKIIIIYLLIILQLESIDDFKRNLEMYCRSEEERAEKVELRRKIKNRVSRYDGHKISFKFNN